MLSRGDTDFLAIDRRDAVVGSRKLVRRAIWCEGGLLHPYIA